MIPAHAALHVDQVTELLEELRREQARAVCKKVGHLEVEQRRGAPVTEFMHCIRCGKIGERL